MNNRGLELILMLLFGGAGLVLLVAGIELPYLATDRIIAVIGGGLGIGFAAVQAYRLYRSRHRTVPVAVEIRSGENAGKTM